MCVRVVCACMCLCACMSVCVCVHASVCVRVLICFVISLFTQLKKNRRDWRRKDWRKRERRRRDSRMKGKSQKLETSSDEGELLYARKSTTWSSHARTVRLHSLPLLQGTATCRFTTMFAEESTSTGVTCVRHGSDALLRSSGTAWSTSVWAPSAAPAVHTFVASLALLANIWRYVVLLYPIEYWVAELTSQTLHKCLLKLFNDNSNLYFYISFIYKNLHHTFVIHLETILLNIMMWFLSFISIWKIVQFVFTSEWIKKKTWTHQMLFLFLYQMIIFY